MMRGDKGGNVMAGAMAVVAGRAARPCDVCGRKRARWYCAADEAYLCEACDSSVHAANALALRHERVRLAPNGAPMKMERRNINNSGEPVLLSRAAAAAVGPPSSNKKKLKSRRSPLCPPSISGPGCVPQLEKLREVKVELPGTDANSAIDPSDDHFTAEELTGNANLLDDECCPSNDCSTASGCNHHGSLPGADASQDFLLSDPNDCNANNNNFRCSNGNYSHGTKRSAGAAGVEDVNDHDKEIKQGGIGNRWMELDLGNRQLGEDDYGVDLGSNGDLSDDEYCPDIGNNVDLSDDEYCVDLAALRGSVSADETVPTYARPGQDHNNNREKSSSVMVPGLTGSKAGKPFKNIAGQSEWVKMEAGTRYNPNMSHEFAPGCKMEGFNDSDLRQVPSLRLDYADVLSSWPDRGMLWTSDGHGNPDPRFGPDDSNSGGCYDTGLVPDFANGGGAGHAGMYGPGSGMGDDGSVSAGNAREARVIRYREKRRTRLFSKKIRYEVRKLNAERRPRMKGRFVKRSPGRD